MARMAKRKENEFEKLGRLIKGEGEDIRDEIKSEVGRVERKVDEGFARVERRLNEIIQMQLDEHASRIKKLETAVFSGR